MIGDSKIAAARRSRIIINLASKEYSKCIEKYLQPDDRYITCVFGEFEGDKVVQKGVYAKMARGEMVRFMVGIHAETPLRLKDSTGADIASIRKDPQIRNMYF